MKLLVVGSGFSGAVIARELADQMNCEIDITEERDHLGGNCHTERDQNTEIMVHAYGPHIFNTGVYAARTTTIRKLLEIYNHEHQYWVKNFSHYACQQWIISYVIQSNSIFRVLEMPTSFHSHCHRPSLLPNAGSYVDQLGILRSEQSDLPVLLNHKCCELFGPRA